MSDTTVPVHQALHGYKDGHRLLATSLQIKGRDAERLLVISDVSGPNARIDSKGYLTGYPLAESGVYAFARTWPATEISRPGCVWTHTLLIDFADLASAEDLEALSLEFQRPSEIARFDAYRTPRLLALNVSDAGHRNKMTPRTALAAVLLGLYGNPERKVFVSSYANFDVERWTIAIWNQQWPRLRRSFRFCTLSYADRSVREEPFDLQFIPPLERGQLIRIKDQGHFVDLESDIDPPDRTPWLRIAVDDLSVEHLGALRKFFRSAGAEKLGGRGAFAFLFELYALLGDGVDRSGSLRRAVEMTGEHAEDHDYDLAKKVVAESAFEHVSEVDAETLRFLAANLHTIGLENRQQRAFEFCESLWFRNRLEFWRLLQRSQVEQDLAHQYLRSVPVKDLADVAMQEPQSIDRLADVRPEILNQPVLWLGSMMTIDAALATLQKRRDGAAGAIEAMIASGVSGLETRVVRALGSAVLLSGVTNHLDLKDSDELSKTETEWTDEAIRNADVLALHLAEGKVRTKVTLLAIARATNPDVVPNKIGPDPWLAALRASIGDLSRNGQIYLAAYVFARALGTQSRSPAELLVFGFDTIYKAAAKSDVPSESWKMLDYRLPDSIFGFEWDKCRRLRAAVTNTFVARQLPFDLFASVTADDEVFREITRTMGEWYAGRRYLRELRSTLKDHRGALSNRRYRIVDEAL